MSLATPTLRTHAPLLLFGFFCLHVLGTGIASLPPNANGLPLRALRIVFEPSTRPYILLPSQWQNWGLFAPDPLRESTAYIVERHGVDNTWQPWRTIASETLPWYRTTDWLKFTRMVLSDNERYRHLHEPFLHGLCKGDRIASKTAVRIRVERSDIFRPEHREESILIQTHCP